MKNRLILLVVALGLTLTSCAQDTEVPQETDLEAPATQEEEVVEPVPEPESTFTLPEGYPKVVDIETIPDQMRWAFEEDGTGQAVAVAEGVWAHLTPGASMEDAVNTLVFDGYCASKEALEQKYLNGESTAGTCW